MESDLELEKCKSTAPSFLIFPLIGGGGGRDNDGDLTSADAVTVAVVVAPAVDVVVAVVTAVPLADAVESAVFATRPLANTACSVRPSDCLFSVAIRRKSIGADDTADDEDDDDDDVVVAVAGAPADTGFVVDDGTVIDGDASRSV